jgi:hypothetical protein
MSKYFYTFRNRPTGPFANGQGMTNITAGPSGKTRDITEYGGGDKVLRITQGTTSGQDLTAFDAHNNPPDDFEMTTMFAVGAGVQVPGSFGILFWDYTAANQGLSLGFLPASSTKSLILYDDKAGTTVAFANFNWISSTIYRVRWRIVGGNQHYVKIWAYTDPEPGTWTFTTTYANRTTGSKYFGLGTYTAGHVIDYYNVGTATGGDTAPLTQKEADDYNNSLLPSSTPAVGYGGAYGGIGGYAAKGYGQAVRPALQDTALVIANASHTHTVDAVVVTQVHNLTVDNDTHTHTADNIALTQAHTLVVANASHTHSVDNIALAQTYILATANASHTHTADSIVLVAGFAAVPANAAHSLTSDNIVLAQAHTLVIDSASHTHTVSSVTLIESKLLVVDNSAHTLVDSIGDLSQVHNLVVGNTTHSLVTDSVALLQNQLLAIQNAAHSLTSTNVDIIQFTLLGTPNSSVIGVTDSGAAMIVNRTLAVDNALHPLHSTEIPKIFNWDDLGFYFGYYRPAIRPDNGVLTEEEIAQGYIAPRRNDNNGTFEQASIDEGFYIPVKIDKGNF